MRGEGSITAQHCDRRASGTVTVRSSPTVPLARLVGSAGGVPVGKGGGAWTRPRCQDVHV